MSDEQNKDQVEETQTEEAAPAAEAEAPAAEEASEEAPAADDSSDEGEEVEVPAEFKDLVEKVEKMTVLELSELVKILEKKFGVTAVAAAAPAAGGDAGAEEKDEFTVHLADAGAQKIAVIKVVKEVAGLGLKEAKELVDGAPADVKANVKTEEAEEIKAKLEEAGAKVELK
jgi:large subunit ribosomal protein L7/L12